MRNYNVELDLQETERLRDLADTTEQLDTITIGMMGIEDYSFDSGDDDYELASECSSIASITEDPEWISYRDYTFPYDFRLPLQEELGDALAAKAEAQLSYWGFYPGDGYKNTRGDEYRPEQRFHVYQTGNDMYAVMGSLWLGDEPLVSKSDQ